QLIVSDEAHRTISGNNRAIFMYFVGAKLGLTATPKDYLKGVNTGDPQHDPREYERRLLLDTYRTFGCDDGRPTFRYSLTQAVQHVPPYLVNPTTFDARTEITTQMLSDEGYTVTGPPGGAQQMTLDFANNNLNGKSKWRENEFRDYNTSRTRVCVTVGMMTTGYDCEDILNVVLARPMMSPTDFIQIKGRGTRLFTFKHEDGQKKQKIDKDSFGLFDFFANCEYFEEDFDYDQKLIPPREPLPPGPNGGGGGGGIRIDTLTSTSPDPIATVADQQIGQWGMRIDREMYRDRFADQANEAVAADTILRDAFDAEDWPAVEERIRRLLFEKPEEFWNLPKLQEVYKTDRS